MNHKVSNIVNYIIKFLLQGNEHLIKNVGYTSNRADFYKYNVIIIPSGFFDDDNYGNRSFSPKLPLEKIEDTEFLFGKSEIEFLDNKIIVKADIIASSFFFLARYEEFLAEEDCFDIHHRFEGRKSLLYRSGLLNRPIVDEYGKLLVNWLKSAGCNTKKTNYGFDKIYLTHDIDSIGLYQNSTAILKAVFNAIFKKNGNPKNIFSSFFDIKNDPAFTFEWLINEDNQIKEAEKIFFIKANKTAENYDLPYYNLKNKAFKYLYELFEKHNCRIGLHSSYKSFFQNSLISEEYKSLQETTKQNISLHRSHYLTIFPPNSPKHYIEVGIKEDFTLSFASVCGFRLGTCHQVEWINPETLDIEPIIIHPLTIMDCTLSNVDYMNLDYESALNYAKNIIEQVKKHNGQLVLLWHNTSVAKNLNSYHAKLYKNILFFLNFTKKK